MIVPSLDLTGASVDDEAHRLATGLRYAAQEAQFTGKPLRWVATRHGWYFEVLVSPDADSDSVEQPSAPAASTMPQYVWQAYEEAPLETYYLPAPLLIQKVRQAVDLDLGVTIRTVQGASDNNTPQIVGKVLFLPDGTTSQSDIVLASEDAETAVVVLEVRPGPAGISIKKTE